MTNNLPSFSVGKNDQSTSQPQTAQSQPVVHSMNVPVGSMSKEQMEILPSPSVTENVPLVEVSENEPVPEQVSSWIEKLEKGEDVQLPQPITHDDQVLVSPANPQIDEEKIILPMTEKQVEKGLHEQLFTGARWLAEWCVRLVKKFHGKVVYREDVLGEEHGAS